MDTSTKMADEMNQNIEDALNKIVNTTEQSGNMRKDLKRTIFETVSTLRNLFYKLKETLDEKTKQNTPLEKEFNKRNKELYNCRSTSLMGQAETPNVRNRNQQEPIVDRCCHLTAAIGSSTPA